MDLNWIKLLMLNIKVDNYAGYVRTFLPLGNIH